MTAKTRIEAYLPRFGGFFQSGWDHSLAADQRRCARSYADEERGEGALRIEDFGELLAMTCDTKVYAVAIARCFCRRFEKELNATRGLRVGLQFSRVECSADYVRDTDRIVATIPIAGARMLLEASATENHARLARAIRDRFTTLPRLAPYYSDRPRDWLSKPVERWDRNELCVLLDAFVASDIDALLLGDIAASGESRKAFSNAVDWGAFEAKAAGRRMAKVAAAAKLPVPAETPPTPTADIPTGPNRS
jgi:hypothetical protein